jgi:hypothetical protein
MNAGLAALLMLVIGGQSGAAQSAAGIQRAAWLQGCWELVSPTRSVEESWMTARGGSMIGVSRTIRNGKTTAYEMIVLREEGGRLAYEAHPSGQPPATFLSTRISQSELVFENPKHDFPQRIIYILRDRQLCARIEGGTEAAQEWCWSRR